MWNWTRGGGLHTLDPVELYSWRRWKGEDSFLLSLSLCRCLCHCHRRMIADVLLFPTILCEVWHDLGLELLNCWRTDIQEFEEGGRVPLLSTQNVFQNIFSEMYFPLSCKCIWKSLSLSSCLNILQFAELMQPPGKVQLWPESFPTTNPRNNPLSLFLNYHQTYDIQMLTLFHHIEIWM